MPQIQYFTAAQEVLIPEYQAKWRQIERLTQPMIASTLKRRWENPKPRFAKDLL